MRVAISLALLGCLTAVMPCQVLAARAPAPTHRCCCDPAASSCCCRAESGQSRAPAPAAPSSKVASGDAADLAGAGPADAPAGIAHAPSWILARLAGAETGARYLTARSFRC